MRSTLRFASGNLLVGLRPEPATQSRPYGDHQAQGEPQ